MSIVLAEDKQHYQDVVTLYAGAETIFQEEDTQPIVVPIIAPTRTINFDLVEDQPELNFTYEYLEAAMNVPRFIRTISLVGALHAGKTSFLDLVVNYVRDTRSQKERDSVVMLARSELKSAGNQAVDSPWDNFKQTKSSTILAKYTDTRLDERERRISLKSTPLSYLVPDSRGKSHVIHIIDTPGHVNFRDECDASVRISDGVAVVVDSVIGATECLKQQIRSLITVGGFEPSHLVLVLTQVDRFVLELRMPPTDAFFKLKHIIDDLNVFIAETLGTRTRTFRPETGNVVFASGKYNFAFTLESFARVMYATAQESPFLLLNRNRLSSISEEAESFGRLLWGDMYCESGTFSNKPTEPGTSKRTFVQFVLEPLYKILGACVGEEKEQLQALLSEVGVYLPSHILDSDVDVVIQSAMDCLFGTSSISCFVDTISPYIPHAIDGGARIARRFYAGSTKSEEGAAMASCDPQGPLMVHCLKSMHTPDCTEFRVLARIFSGTIKKGDSVRLLGESYSFRNGETEDQVVSTVSRVLIPGGRYFVETHSAPAGNLVILEGLSAMRKTCTLVSLDRSEEAEIFRPLAFSTYAPTIKVSCEPLQPADLPRLVEALRRLDRAYPQLVAKVEESGEHVIIGTGELYLDCALHDLRKLYGGDRLLEIKLSDPVVVFNETCSETSQFQCSAASPNKLNALSFIAEPLSEQEVSILTGPEGERARGYEDREIFFLSKEFKKERSTLLTDRAGWDALAARNLWAFGPDWTSPSSSCVLLNDTLPDQVPKTDLLDIREGVVQGFQWATREGPLVEEPLRNCKVKLLDAILHGEDEIARGSGQIIPTACRAIHASILTAGPRLLEPVNLVEIEVPADLMDAVMKVLSKRRGHVVRDWANPGTVLKTVIAHVPAIESFGLETDLRLYTKGMGFCLSWFDHWAVVPGDPLDQQVGQLPPLEPAPQMYLARDFLLKTRRRKGLAEDIVVQKYIDDVVSLGLFRGEEPGQAPEDEYW